MEEGYSKRITARKAETLRKDFGCNSLTVYEDRDQIQSVSLITFPLLASSWMLAFLSKQKFMDEITPPLFENWCQKYGKVYFSEKEKLYRFKVFKRNYAKIIRYNKNKKPYHCTNGLNEAADLTNREFYVYALRKGYFPRKEAFRHPYLRVP